MSPAEFTTALRHANSTGGQAEFASQLRRLDDDELYHLLFPLAVSSQLDCPAACGAAMLLDQFRPACPVLCKEAVRAALPAWDIGISEVPRYLVAVFGKHRVLEVVRELVRESLPDREVSRLRAIGYFLRVPDSERLQWRGSGSGG